MTQDMKQTLRELLAAKASGSINRNERIELEGLLTRFPDENTDELELTAAEVDLAFGGEDTPLPSTVRQLVATDAAVFFSKGSGGEKADEAVFKVPAAVEKKRRARIHLSGWLVAAAILIVSSFGWWPLIRSRPGPPSTEQQRAMLLMENPRLLPLSWSATGDEAGPDASGDVVWDKDSQRGFMRFAGLLPNDPQQAQYQLWIFDKDRDDRYPIDGGVFDIPEGRDRVVVPIHAMLGVKEPVLFAVTVEKPGGVVVSSREHIVVVAKPGP